MTRVRRELHPGAWWLWALGLAAGASRTTNPLLLLLLVAAAGFVVAARRGSAPWARSYEAYLRLAVVVIGIRLVFQVLVGSPVPGHVVLRLPEVPLPSWFAGVRLGGAITVEALAGALYQALQLAALLACVGAANALANPRRLLRLVPGALYEAGVAVVVAMSFSPQLLEAVARVRDARRLRGHPSRGLRGVRGIALPVLYDALDRSVALAAAMDARGYGRTVALPRRARLATDCCLLAALVGACLGVVGLLDSGSRSVAPLGALAAGAVLAVVGLALGSRRTLRTRYRPEPWASPEWLVAGSGIAAALVLAIALRGDPAAAHPGTSPLQVPALPLLAVVAALVALLPAWAAPEPPSRPAGPVAARPRGAASAGGTP